MLFSEPKIPQSSSRTSVRSRRCVSVLFSEPKIPQSAYQRRNPPLVHSVSVLFSEPKIPQFWTSSSSGRFGSPVSVLFSEPKIPQSSPSTATATGRQGFSALQRAENSSMSISAPVDGWCASFSALQRAENSSIPALHIGHIPHDRSFSALQRAENSSMRAAHRRRPLERTFQCSSASRKFLNVQPG